MAVFVMPPGTQHDINNRETHTQSSLKLNKPPTENITIRDINKRPSSRIRLAIQEGGLGGWGVASSRSYLRLSVFKTD